MHLRVRWRNRHLRLAEEIGHLGVNGGWFGAPSLAGLEEYRQRQRASAGEKPADRLFAAEPTFLCVFLAHFPPPTRFPGARLSR